MSIYLSLEYTGDIDKVIEYLNEKEWKYEMKRVNKKSDNGKNQLYLVIKNNSFEEVSFFSNITIDSDTDTGLGEFKEISKLEYQNTFEEIEKSKVESQSNSYPSFLKIFAKKKQFSDDNYNECLYFGANEKIIEDEEIKKIKEYLNEVPVTKKSDVEQNSPMGQLSNLNYLQKFLAISTIIILICVIFN